MAMGDRAQARTLYKAGPHRLRRRAPPWRRTVRYTMDSCWSRTVDQGALLAYGLLWLSATATRDATTPDTGRARTCVS